MPRYHTGLTLIASISTVLLLLWGLDLSRSIAQEPPAGSYQADVNVWTEGPFLTMLHKTASMNHHETAVCMIVFRSEHGILIWNRERRPENPDDQPIHLSHRTDAGSTAGCVVLVTFQASQGADGGPGNRTIVMCEFRLSGESPVVVMPPTQISLPASYRFGG